MLSQQGLKTVLLCLIRLSIVLGEVERESKSYDEFDTFTLVPRETIHSYYLRFTQLINDRHTIGMSMKTIQVNTKFVNHLQPEWSKFVTDVKLAKDLHNTNFDQLCAYLRQHEAHAIAFISTAFASRYPPTNNQLKTLSNPRNQTTIQDGRVTVKVVRCYNCQEEGHMARKCAKPKRPRNLAWFKEKMLLAEALKSGVALEEENVTFLADNGDTVTTGQDLVLMAKLSAYDSEVLLEVPPHYTYLGHHVIDQSVQAMRFSEQPPFNNETDFDITSDNAMIMSMIEEMSSQVTKCNERRNINIGEESRLKMHAKQNDAIVKDKKFNIAPIDYAALNKLSENFVKHFVPQKQLSVEQAFWLPISKPMSKPISETPPAHKEPVLKEIPHKLPTISLVKDNFNKIRSHVKNFARL
ncbi:retrovirus-related pol polyprotein from transposon TNT 1-94 [Tanacetum coccineum]